MAKKVDEQEITLIIKLKLGIDPVEVRADYVVTSEGLSESRTLDSLELTTSQLNGLKGIGATVLQKVKKAENI